MRSPHTPPSEDADAWRDYRLRWISDLDRLALSPVTKAVGVRLALHADWQTGRDAYPGVSLLASKTGYSEKSVRRALAQLRELGLIDRTYHGSRAGRRGMADVHRLVLAAELPQLLDHVELLPMPDESRRP